MPLRPRPLLLGAFAELLVRLHLTGFFWGDCSLSNTLFRRDAGKLSAYLVDSETSELHEQLSEGQRTHDLELSLICHRIVKKARESVAPDLPKRRVSDVA